MSKLKHIQLPNIPDKRGNISFFENKNEIPFEIKRTCWIYDTKAGIKLESYAFIKSQEFIVALSGSFDIIINDGISEKKINLNSPNKGLYVPNMLWKTFENFSTNSLVLIVSSMHFDKGDYLSDFKIFKENINEKK